MALTTDDLIVRAEITDVLQRYARGVDRNDMPAVRACYHDDAWDDHNTFRGPVAEFVAWLGDGRLDRHAQTTHFLSTPLIRRTSEDVCQSDTYCVMYQVSKVSDGKRTMVTGELRYLDRFECRGGEWRIAHRRVAEDWRYTTTIGAGDGIPFPEGMRIGRRDRDDASYTDVGPSPTVQSAKVQRRG